MGKLLVRLGLGLIFMVFGLLNYFGNVSENPITGETQRVPVSPQQEIVLGQQARQEVASQLGGLHANSTLQAYVDQVGQRVVQQSEASETPYPFEFHLLSDTETVNALALPGGQIFVTAGLLSRLDTEAQLAGVLGHEIAHVVARHGAEQLARQQLGAMLVNAVRIAASDDPSNAQQAGAIAQIVNQFVSLRYSRDDEIESDRLGFRFMTAAGYNPEGIVELMQILNAAQGQGQQLEFLSTHPNPSNRIVKLKNLISSNYPGGIPESLEERPDRFTQIVKPRLSH